MVCSNCNKEIREGATYCEECGAPIDEPVIIKSIKTVENTKEKNSTPKLEATGPFFDMSGYIKSLGQSPMAILGLVGGLVLYLSPFFGWLWRRLKDNKVSGTLFDIGGKNHEMGLQSNVLIIFAVVVLILGVVMIAVSGGRYIRPLKPVYTNIIVKMLPVLIAVMVFVLIMLNENYKEAVESIERQIDEFKIYGAASNIDGGRGAGPVMYISGVLIYSISAIMSWLEEKK